MPDATGPAPTWARRWGTSVAGISILGTVLASMGVFVLAAAAVTLNEGLGGQDSTWPWWLGALCFAAAGAVGLVLTSRLPVVAYALRLVAMVPLLVLGLVGIWLMIPAALIAACHLSLMLSHIRWTLNGAGRWVVAVLVGVGFAVVTLPVVEVGCRPKSGTDCEYNSILGWGFYERQQPLLWGGLAVLVAVIVGLPVARDEQDLMV